MVLKTQVEWALHCCAILAGKDSENYVPTKDLAEFHGVPKEYLSKALQALSQAGLIETSLGPQGGCRLAKPPSKISFLDIVEAVEGRKPTFVCQEIRKNNPCRPSKYKDTQKCSIARVMYGADEAWRAHLKSVTLSELGESLTKEVPKEILEKSLSWFDEK